MTEANFQAATPVSVADSRSAVPGTSNVLEVAALPVGDLQAVTLTVNGGQCVMIGGASGSGKTRLLRAIADLDPAPADSEYLMTLDGVDHRLFSGAEWRRRVAYVAAESQWWFDDVARHFTVMPDAEHYQALGLDINLLQRPLSRLSTGERQRLALLRVLVQQPQALLLDEPTASLDPAAARAVEQVIEDYRRRHQAAVLWVSHDPAQIRRISQRYLRLEHGRLLEQADGV